MKSVNFIAEVTEDGCRGDRLCEKVCPCGAIRVEGKIAVVEPSKCLACGKCVDVCRQGAVDLVVRSQPMMVAVGVDDVDPVRMQEICAGARCAPDQFVCVCTGTTAGEVAAAIVKGAKSPEDVVCKTGAGSGCGIYCMGVVFRIFKAAGVEIPRDSRWYALSLSVWDISEDVVRKYPGYYLEEDRKAFSS
ncbi:MAG: (Fe-S)-binding protein [Proteobacteria bacterium]|nr:(Fe-S)-binding protein [Pseudomonadota bacterium]